MIKRGVGVDNPSPCFGASKNDLVIFSEFYLRTCLTSSDTDQPDPMQPNPTDWLIHRAAIVDFNGHGWTL